jgi:hypothetical protein
VQALGRALGRSLPKAPDLSEVRSSVQLLSDASQGCRRARPYNPTTPRKEDEKKKGLFGMPMKALVLSVGSSKKDKAEQGGYY